MAMDKGENLEQRRKKGKFQAKTIMVTLSTLRFFGIVLVVNPQARMMILAYNAINISL